MTPGTISHLVRWERRALPVRLLVAAAAAAGLGYYDPGPGSIAGATGIGMAAYGVYAVALVLLLLPRLRRWRGVYVLALGDAAAVGAALYASGGVATPFVALMPLVVAYYAGLHGYGPGLTTAVVLSAGFIVAVTLRQAGVQTDLAIASQVPVLFLLALLGGYVSRRWQKEPASPAPGSFPPGKEAATPRGALEAARHGTVAPPDGPAVTLERTGDVSKPGEPATPVTVGGLYVDGARGQVLIGGRPVALSPTEIQLLQLLVEQPGVPLGHDVIRERLWGANYQGQGNVVDVTIHRLRRKMERQGFPGCILTVRGRGYMLGSIQS